MPTFTCHNDAPPPALAPAAKRGVAVALAAAHLALVMLWLHGPSGREQMAQIAPVLVSLVQDSRNPRPEPPPALPLPPAATRPSVTPVPLPDLPPPEIAPRADAPPAPPATAPMTAAALVDPPPAAPVVAATPPEPVILPLAPPPTLSIHQVRYLTPPVPDYPLASRRQGEEGQVRLRVLIGTDGAPQKVELLQSSGHRRLDDAALAAARAARFQPYTENGQPRMAWVVMPLVFELQT